MEFVLLWLFVSIEKIAAFLAIGGTLFKWSLFGYFLTYGLAFVLSNGEESFKNFIAKMKWQRRVLIVSTVIGAVLFTTSNLLPNKKELAIIVGGGMTYQMLTSDTAKEIGGKAVELLKKQIDDALQEDVINQVKKEATETAKEKVKEVVKEATNA